jgi:hypothetical protein
VRFVCYFVASVTQFMRAYTDLMCLNQSSCYVSIVASLSTVKFVLRKAVFGPSVGMGQWKAFIFSLTLILKGKTSLYTGAHTAHLRNPDSPMNDQAGYVPLSDFPKV